MFNNVTVPFKMWGPGKLLGPLSSKLFLFFPSGFEKIILRIGFKSPAVGLLFLCEEKMTPSKCAFIQVTLAANYY